MRYYNSIIPEEYWNELNNSGTCVPRRKDTGEVIPHGVGSICNVRYPRGKEKILAICTQDCPYHLRKIKEEELNVNGSRL